MQASCEYPWCKQPAVRFSYCAKHAEMMNPKRTTQRKRQNKRYQSVTWQNLRRMKLARDPLCEDCIKTGRAVPAVDVHHMDRVQDGNDVLTSLDRLMSLCKSCHTTRTNRGE